MKTENISVHAEIPARPERIYQDWLSSEGHTAFTGGVATINNEVGSNYTAWDGYISGKITTLEPNKRIVQSWRTSEFPKDASDSVLEIIITPSGDNESRVTFNHTSIPKGDGKKYLDGWKHHYVDPMIAYYSE